MEDEVSDLQPPASLSDHVTAFGELSDEFHDRLHLLDVYGEAARLSRAFTTACYTNNKAASDEAWNAFLAWADQYHSTFRSPVILDDDLRPLPSPPMTMKELDGLVRGGRLADLQAKVEGLIHQHSDIKAFHFLPGDTSQGWEDFHWFCRAFNFLEPLRRNRFCFYFLIQLPSP